MKSGVGFAARHQGDQHVATAQIATTGLISLNYAHKLSEKVSFEHNHFIVASSLVHPQLMWEVV